MNLELRNRISPPPGGESRGNFKSLQIDFKSWGHRIRHVESVYKEAVETKKKFFRKVKERLDKTGVLLL